MICIECFNRSRVDGLQLVCSPFFCRLVPSLASGVEYCHGCNFAPVWCPRWHPAWSIATAATLRPSGALVGIRHGVLPRLRLCARLVPPLASGMEYCHGCDFAPVLVPSLASGMEYCHGGNFAPVLVPSLASGMEYCHGGDFAPVWYPRWHQAWSIATAATLRPSGALVGIRHGVLPRLQFCVRPWCHYSTLYTLYNITDIRDPASVPTRYRSYRASQILGNCKQM